MANSDIKQHISIEERLKWNKVVADFTAHQGATGTTVHALGNGTSAGFSQCDFTPAEKTKLEGIAPGALNNPHPAEHDYTMIKGLATVAHTGKYSDLIDVPMTFTSDSGDADTVGGIRVTIGSSEPPSPQNNKEIWFDTNTMTIKAYKGGKWESFGAVFG